MRRKYVEHQGVIWHEDVDVFFTRDADNLSTVNSTLQASWLLSHTRVCVRKKPCDALERLTSTGKMCVQRGVLSPLTVAYEGIVFSVSENLLTHLFSVQSLLTIDVLATN